MQIFRVGGAIRDELLGRPVSDADFVVLGCSEGQFLKRFPEAKRVGTRKPVYIYRGQEYTLSRESDIAGDLAQRDLTVNALARDEHGRLHASEQSLRDLRRRILRPVRPENFFRDPLRVFRAARLAACLPDFSVHRELEALMQSMAGSPYLEQPAAERVGRETLKACSCNRPGRFLELLSRTGTLRPWFGELIPGPRQESASEAEARLQQRCSLMNDLAGYPLAVWMAACLDLSPEASRKPGSAVHPLPTEQDPAAALRLAERLRLPRRSRQAGAAAVRWACQAADYSSLKAEEAVELLERLKASELLEPLFRLAGCLRGQDLLIEAYADLSRLQSVRLPASERNLGAESGRRLRDLRCRALRRR
jgi:tRNA nucleotidyltransferase (CCA-adding enzyme)